MDHSDNETFLNMMEAYFGRPAEEKAAEVKPELHYQVNQRPCARGPAARAALHLKDERKRQGSTPSMHQALLYCAQAHADQGRPHSPYAQVGATPSGVEKPRVLVVSALVTAILRPTLREPPRPARLHAQSLSSQLTTHHAGPPLARRPNHRTRSCRRTCSSSRATTPPTCRRAQT